MDITQALYDKLSTDATLVALLANYPSGSPQSPAIFASWPVPADASRPYIFTHGNVSVSHFDELASLLGQSIIRDVTAIADNTGSDADIETIGERIRALLHRTDLTLPVGTHVMTQCIDGPTVAETDDTLTGRRLSFRITAMED